MLPAAARMRRRQDFELAVRRGRRVAGRFLAVHLFVEAGDTRHAGEAGGRGGREARHGGSRLRVAPDGHEDRRETTPALVGFIVSRAVGGAVVRNRVRRRLREAARARTGSLPPGSLLVIRASPRAADVRQRDLAAELDLVLGRLLRRQG